MTSKGVTAPYIVSSSLRMVATGACGPKLLTTSAGGPLRDLEIQFLTVDSGNLTWASLTSWIHLANVVSFLFGGTSKVAQTA